MTEEIIKEEFDKAFKKNFPEVVIIDGVNVAECTYFQQEDDEYTCGAEECNGAVVGCRACDNCYYKQFKRLEQELKWANDEEKYLKDCCIKAGKELEKYSFKWDGKEKNLAVQALQLNQLYEELEQENKELKKQIESQKGLITVGGKQQYQYLQRIDELEQENKELKEWKDKVVKLFESACRCKYLNEEKDICSYTNEKCININKCVYKYQELSDTYRSALEEIRELTVIGVNVSQCNCGLRALADDILNKINECIGG